MRQAYDYWQDQPGSIPQRRRCRSRVTHERPPFVALRNRRTGSRSLARGDSRCRTKRVRRDRLELEAPCPRGGPIRELGRSIAGQGRAAMRRPWNANDAFASVPRPLQACSEDERAAKSDYVKPSVPCEVRSTGNRRATKAVALVSSNLKRRAWQDVAAPAGIQPDRTRR